MCRIEGISVSPMYLRFSVFRNEAILYYSTTSDRSGLISADNQFKPGQSLEISRKYLLVHVTDELQVKLKKGNRMGQVGMDKGFVLTMSKFRLYITYLFSNSQSCLGCTDSVSANCVSSETSRSL